MSLSRVKNWIAGEVLTASDLNTEYNNILNNPGSLICPIGFNLTFTDATYDIGASGATRPRDLFLSRNAVIGGTLGVTGKTTGTGGFFTDKGSAAVTNGGTANIITLSVAGLYIFFVHFPNSVASSTLANAFVACGGTSVRIQSQTDGSAVSINLSGNTVRMQNDLGSTQTLYWSYLFIPAV